VLGSFLFYDPIGFGFDIVTSDIVGLRFILITILFFVVMRKTRNYLKRIASEAEILKNGSQKGY
jgi:hypothetical protein